MTKASKFGIQTNGNKHAHSDAMPDNDTRFGMVRDAGACDYVDKTLDPDQIDDFLKARDKYGMPVRAVGSRHLEAAKAGLEKARVAAVKTAVKREAIMKPNPRLLIPAEIIARSN